MSANPASAPVSAEDFLRWMDEAKAWADSVGYEEKDISSVIQTVRKERQA